MRQIRSAQHGDFVAIAKLSQHMGYPAVADDVSAARLKKIILAPDHKLWVCTHKQQIAGWAHAFVALRAGSASFIELAGLIIDPGYRRLGLGKALIHEAHTWASTLNRVLRVRCNTNRLDAHSFYQSLGFKQTKSQYIFERS